MVALSTETMMRRERRLSQPSFGQACKLTSDDGKDASAVLRFCHIQRKETKSHKGGGGAVRTFFGSAGGKCPRYFAEKSFTLARLVRYFEPMYSATWTIPLQTGLIKVSLKWEKLRLVIEMFRAACCFFTGHSHNKLHDVKSIIQKKDMYLVVCILIDMESW